MNISKENFQSGNYSIYLPLSLFSPTNFIGWGGDEKENGQQDTTYYIIRASWLFWNVFGNRM